jgi:hypothetical protein
MKASDSCKIYKIAHLAVYMAQGPNQDTRF